MTILIDDVPYTPQRTPFAWLRVGSPIKLKLSPTLYPLKVAQIKRQDELALVMYPNGSGFWVEFCACINR